MTTYEPAEEMKLSKLKRELHQSRKLLKKAYRDDPDVADNEDNIYDYEHPYELPKKHKKHKKKKHGSIAQ